MMTWTPEEYARRVRRQEAMEWAFLHIIIPVWMIAIFGVLIAATFGLIGPA